MRTVCGPDGARYVLLEGTTGAEPVLDPSTGERVSIEPAKLDPIEDASPLAALAEAVPGPVRDLLAAVRDERALGLLVDLHDRGPRSADALLAGTGLCESDLHGVVTELRVAGLVDEATVAGRRGYALTDRGRRAVEHVRRAE